MKSDNRDAWHRLFLLFIRSSWLFLFTQTSLKKPMQKSTRLLVMRGFRHLRIVHTFLTLMLSSWKFFDGMRSYQQVRIEQNFTNETDDGLAVPHRVMQDDIHEGYFIPKGALIIPNIWWDKERPSCLKAEAIYRKCLHDPRIYNDPFRFNPERFIVAQGRKPEPDPREVCFGFGRRQVGFSGSVARSLTLIFDSRQDLSRYAITSSFPWRFQFLILSSRITPRRCLGFHRLCDGLGCVWCFKMHWTWSYYWACARLHNRDYKVWKGACFRIITNICAVIRSRSNAASSHDLRRRFRSYRQNFDGGGYHIIIIYIMLKSCLYSLAPFGFSHCTTSFEHRWSM